MSRIAVMGTVDSANCWPDGDPLCRLEAGRCPSTKITHQRATLPRVLLDIQVLVRVHKLLDSPR